MYLPMKELKNNYFRAYIESQTVTLVLQFDPVTLQVTVLRKEYKNIIKNSTSWQKWNTPEKRRL